MPSSRPTANAPPTPGGLPGFSIRRASEVDMPAIAALYGHYVRTSSATFDLDPPTAEDMAVRLRDLNARGLPYLVAEENGIILGFAYAGPYRVRIGYRYTVEDSVYVAHNALGRGVGSSLLAALIERCTRLGYRQMIAIIGDSANAGSMALHSRLGFVAIGTLPATGFKFGRWIDSVLMQRALGDGRNTQPGDLGRDADL